MNAIDFSHVLQANGYQVRGHRAQCPGHNGKDMNLSFRDDGGETLLMTCFSNHCSVNEIMAGVGLSMKDAFPANDSFNHTEYQQRKTQYQIDQECITCYRILALFNADVKSAKTLLATERDYARQALKTLEKYNFTHGRYKQLMNEQSFNAAYQHWGKLSTEQKYRI